MKNVKDLTQKLFKLRNDAKTLSEIAHTYKEKYENLKNQKEKEQGTYKFIH